MRREDEGDVDDEEHGGHVRELTIVETPHDRHEHDAEGHAHQLVPKAVILVVDDRRPADDQSENDQNYDDCQEGQVDHAARARRRTRRGAWHARRAQRVYLR